MNEYCYFGHGPEDECDVCEGCRECGSCFCGEDDHREEFYDPGENESIEQDGYV